MRNWQLVLPPNRLCINTILLLRHLITSLSLNEHVCLLGSTPEYRTELRKHFKNITIIDSNLDFKNVSDDISGTSSEENFYNADWLCELSNHKCKFDLVVSHSTHGNIPFSARNNFFQLIHGSLKKPGYFFDTIFQPSNRLYSIKDIDLIFKNRPNNIITANEFSCIAIFQSTLIKELNCIDSSSIYAWLESKLADNNINRIIDTAKLITPQGMKWFYSLDMPASYFGYDDLFERLSEVPELPSSPFFNSLYHVTSRSK